MRVHRLFCREGVNDHDNSADDNHLRDHGDIVFNNIDDVNRPPTHHNILHHHHVDDHDIHNHNLDFNDNNPDDDPEAGILLRRPEPKPQELRRSHMHRRQNLHLPPPRRRMLRPPADMLLQII